MSHHEDVETMGGRIRQARKAARLTQEALAELAEMNRVSVADLGRRRGAARARRAARGRWGAPAESVWTRYARR